MLGAACAAADAGEQGGEVEEEVREHHVGELVGKGGDDALVCGESHFGFVLLA